MMQYGFEYQRTPARPGFVANGTPTIEVEQGIGEQWFGNKQARDYFMKQ